tara:strand:+ start:2800 stop:3507 length:708 start_codon:yes stop_codon:yes gene_type:complete
MKLKIDKIFCCHHPSEQLSARRKKLEDFFSKNELQVEWVTSFTPEDTKQYNTESLLRNIQEKGPQNCRGFSEEAVANACDLTAKSASLLLKHNYCYEQQLEHGYSNILILEDDVNLEETFSENYFNKCLDEYKKQNLEMLFLGSCCNLHYPNTKSDQYVYYDQSLRTRCTHCYVVNLRASQRILNHCYKFLDSVDWQLNHIIDIENIRTGWAEPSIKQLNYKSSLNPEGDITNEN